MNQLSTYIPSYVLIFLLGIWLQVAKFNSFDLILYVPVNNLSVMSGRVFLGWTSIKDKCVLLKETTKWHSETQTRAPLSRVKHSTTEPLCSRKIHE